MEYKVDFHDRIRRRHRKKAVRNYLKGLTELTTNSDGSYRNLEERGEKVSGEIIITLDRITRMFQVLDNGEGMTKETMQEIFTQTGAKHKTQRKGGRSLFGKGLPDTLFSPIIEIGSGEVHSIREDKYSVAIFKKNKNGEEVVEIKPDEENEQRVTTQLRKKLGIAKNGTLVKFKLSNKEHFPRDETFVKDISNFYMMRLINTNPNRKIKLVFLNEGKLLYETPIRYKEPSDKIKVGKTIKAEINFDKYPVIKITGELYKT